GGGEGPAEDLGLLGGSGEVVTRREVVPTNLLGRVSAGEVERVDGRAVAIAARARRCEERLCGLLERRPIGAGGIDVRIEGRIARDGVRARLARYVDWRIAGVVLGRAVLDPAAKRLIPARRGVEDRATDVLDVGGHLNLSTVPELNLQRIRRHVLHQHGRLEVWAVVEEQVASVVEPGVARQVQVS